MFRPRHPNGWEGVEKTVYKDEPGVWEKVDRHVLYSSDRSSFETRCFEVAPGGYSSYESHEHEHCVVVLYGQGIATVGQDRRQIGPQDVVIVPSQAAHQFENPFETPLGILCIVDRERDRPTLLGNNPLADTSDR